MYINTRLTASVSVKIVNVVSKDTPVTSDYQFILIQKGSISYECDFSSYTLGAGDIVIVPPNLYYTIKPLVQDSILIGVRIDQPFIDSLIPRGSHLDSSLINTPSANRQKLAKILEDFCSCYYSPDNENLISSVLYSLVDCLTKHFIHKDHSEKTTEAEKRNNKRTDEIIQYINTHYQLPLTLSTLSEELFLSPQYLSKFITKYLGTSFSKYLNKTRLEYAHIELIKTTESITSIALNNGFPSVAAFNKSFRESYGCSPGTYRQNNVHKNIIDSYDLPEHTDLLHSDKPEIISIDSRNPHAYKKNWLDTINIGYLPDALSNSFYEHFTFFNSLAHVKYVRFNGVFDESIISYDSVTKNYDFTVFDEIIHFLHSLDIIPFVELCFKPKRNYFNTDNDDNTYADMFKNEKKLNYYLNLFEAMLHHCIFNYGYNYMNKWRFEVWHKHTEKLLCSETPQEYILKFNNFKKILKSSLPMSTIGGPGFNMCGDISHFRECIYSFEAAKLPLDFISLYAYAYEVKNTEDTDGTFSHIGIVSTDPFHISNSLSRYKDIISGTIYNDIPIYITELGSLLSSNTYIYDSVFQGTYLCQNISALLEKCDSVAYKSFWGSTSPITYSSGLYQASSEMISEKGIPKPPVHTFTMLSRLGKILIARGENYILTCDSSNRYQLLVFNYIHFSKSFCFNSWDNVPIDKTYEIFDNSEPLDLHFSIKHIISGRYKVYQRLLSRNYGSALDKYLRILDHGNISIPELLSTILNFTENEASYYKLTSVPKQDIYYMNCNNELDLKITLSPHEVQFYEFTRIL